MDGVFDKTYENLDRFNKIFFKNPTIGSFDSYTKYIHCNYKRIVMDYFFSLESVDCLVLNEITKAVDAAYQDFLGFIDGHGEYADRLFNISDISLIKHKTHGLFNFKVVLNSGMQREIYTDLHLNATDDAENIIVDQIKSRLCLAETLKLNNLIKNNNCGKSSFVVAKLVLASILSD